MSSLSNINTFTRSMNGLNNINANSIDTQNLDVQTLQIEVSGTAPTRITGDNTINIANTAFVQTAVNTASGNYLTLSGNQTLTTGIKTFTNLPQSSAVPTNNNDIVNKSYTDNTYISLSGNQTINGIKNFVSVPTCSTAPTSSNMLCNKTYVDSIGGVSLSSKNIWTNENDFTNIVKVQDPTVSSSAGIDFFSSITSGIVMNGAPGATNANTGVNLNTNTLTVPIKNNQSLVRVRIPMNIAGFGAPIIYFGQVDLIFNSITAITILKNGSFYKTVSVFDLLNFTGTTKTWTGWSQKGENCRAYLGDVQFELAITTGNTSVDTYTIGITLDISVNASASSYIGVQFLCTGNSNFTTTHATTTTGTTYISTDPTNFFAYQLNFGNFGNYIIGTGDTFIKTIQGGRLNIETGSSIEFLSLANFNSVLPQSTLTPNNNNDLATKLYIDNAISQAITGLTPATNPIGTIIMRASSTVPSGYLYCDGTTYNTTAYAGLWSVIFYTYGGSGNNFKVPDYRACFIRGFGSSTVSGTTYTAPTLGTVQQDSVLALSSITNQGYWNIDAGGGGASRQVKARVRIATDPIDSGAFGAGIDASFPRQNTTENRPVNQSVYYYIKY